MTGLPQQYASPMHLPFNRASLAKQFVLQSPAADPGGSGYGLLLHGNQLLAMQTDSGLALPQGEWPEQSPLYLGLWQGRPCRLLEVQEVGTLWEDLVPCGILDAQPRLPIDLLSLAGLGRMALHWRQRSQFCGYCGQPSVWLNNEWGRRCTACGAQSFPAIHPCAIVLVTRPGEVLLTRKAEWAPNRYSLVAGFQEFAESLEETALREVTEETGVRAGNLRYLGSQCWPFPSQVMVGFVADYLDGEVVVDHSELEDARWFPVDDLPNLPPRRSIARYILDKVLQQV